MEAGPFVQRSYGRAATSCSCIQSRANPGDGMLRKRLRNQTLVATPVDELRIAGGLGVA